mmetsp:Transcript_11508/g.20800  ORF Transcript_11508/g.20800 Transcript_11508/m.20800 type:complete len:141 (-) Transcript_11508:1455-1877(-)
MSENSTEKLFPMLEVMKHTSKDDCWMVIDGKVYDVTKFLVEHPGGEDIMLDSSGRDASREFEDVGHSGDARAQLSQLLIGKLREETEEEKVLLEDLTKQGKLVPTSSSNTSPTPFATVLKFVFPIFILALAYLVRKYTSS